MRKGHGSDSTGTDTTGTGKPDDLMHQAASLLSAASGAQFNHTNNITALQSHEWTGLRDERGRWTGQLRFACASLSELKQIYSNVHGSGIELHGTCCILEIESLFVNMSVGAPSPAPTTSHTATNATTEEAGSALFPMGGVATATG